MNNITTTCGHTVEHITDLWECALAEYNREHKRCIAYVSYCKECYDNAHKQGIILYNQGEENKWING